jgi:hypothetical protein
MTAAGTVVPHSTSSERSRRCAGGPGPVETATLAERLPNQAAAERKAALRPPRPSKGPLPWRREGPPPLRPHDPLDDVDSSSLERPSRSHSGPGALRIEQVCRDRIATYKRPRPVDLRARGCGRGGRDRRPRPSVGNHAGGLLGVNTRGKCYRAPAGTPEPLARTRLPPTARRRAGPRCWSGSTRSA